MIAAEEFFLKLKNQLEQQLPFVAYRPGGKTAVKSLLQKDGVSHEIKSFSESGFVFAPFETENPAFYIPVEAAEAFEIKVSGFSNLKKDDISGRCFSKKNEFDKDQHEKLVSRGIEAIKDGVFQKVVLSRKEKIPLADPDVFFLFKKMLQKYETAFVYLWFHPKTGLWLGATPETLLQVERGRFKTMALAGTQAYKGTTDVFWGEKEKEEQEIVTFSILKNLEETGISEIKKSEPFTVKAGNLLHIRTDIEGKMDGKFSSLKKIITAIHPTPAVCGLPKEAAKSFILKKENYDREFYTGFLGEINMKSEKKRNSNRKNQENQAYGSISKKTSLYVNLRCMKIEDGQAEIFVGGGITEYSDPTAEWEEIQNKAATMKFVLA